jgi:hypothetical protein
MNRREFIADCGSAAVWPMVARGQRHAIFAWVGCGHSELRFETRIRQQPTVRAW